ncbi:hypothetical protein KFK09_022003 [Dendrobium nobile]|uniref:Uncharacterized protein n=1 Tax=Dendrobium nobile TaxID=94219 RepID=A0A8T3AHU6_DENNO|nr:hypothetical protein KFK09_022003 [Dendrobium nobile]
MNTQNNNQESKHGKKSFYWEMKSSSVNYVYGFYGKNRYQQALAVLKSKSQVKRLPLQSPNLLANFRTYPELNRVS